MRHVFSRAKNEPVGRLILPLLIGAGVLFCWRGHAEQDVGEPLTLPHEQLRLDNGLEVVLHPDPRASRVAVNLLYRVGSADESPTRTGVAHLFEHLMFMGTKRVPNKQFDLLLEGAGGWSNAYTTHDMTVYYDVGPAALLETMLWIEADRMATLPAALDVKKLALQRDVVLNEYRQNYQNAPYGVAQLQLPRLSFPQGHPYSWPVIGDPRHLRRVSLRELRQLFRRYYSPKNASLVIAGRFDPARVRELVQRYFGWIPAAGPPLRSKASCPSSAPAVRRVLKDAVELPKLWLAWPSPAAYADGDAELDLLAHILATGKQSRLHRALVHEQRLALDVAAYQHSRARCSQFIVTIRARPGVDLKKLEAATDAALLRLDSERIAAVELQRARNRLETDFIVLLQRPHERADLINRYLALVGRPDYLSMDLARYQMATPQSVQRTAKNTLSPRQRIALWVVPEAAGGAN